MESRRNMAESAAVSAIQRKENQRNDYIYTNKHNHNNLIVSKMNILMKKLALKIFRMKWKVSYCE